MTKLVRRRIKRLLRKLKVLKAKKEFLEFQKFSVICFIGNSKLDTNKTLNVSVAELFNWAVSLASEYFQKFINWLLSWCPKISKTIIRACSNHPAYTIFGFAMCVALLMFHAKLKKTQDSIMKWLEENFKWPLVGCGTIIGLIIVLLVILVTDFPPLPLKKTILALISKLSARLKSSSGLSPEMISESKPQNERNTVIFLSVVTFFFLRYLLDQYKRKVFEDLPFGEILFELYKTDQNPSDPLMPILE